jgi:hypothetical protein
MSLTCDHFLAGQLSRSSLGLWRVISGLIVGVDAVHGGRPSTALVTVSRLQFEVAEPTTSVTVAIGLHFQNG